MKIDGGKKSKNPPFIKRYWWGLLCAFLFFAGGSHQISGKKMPSTLFGGPVFFGKVENGSIFIVEKNTANFRILVSGGEEFIYDKGADSNPGQSPYAFTMEDDTIRIVGITPKLSEKEMNALWERDPVQLYEGEDGTLTVRAGYDAPGQALTGIYIVDGHTVSGHHFQHTGVLNVLAYLTGVLLLYVSGVLVRWIVRFARSRIQHRQHDPNEVDKTRPTPRCQ